MLEPGHDHACRTASPLPVLFNHIVKQCDPSQAKYICIFYHQMISQCFEMRKQHVFNPYNNQFIKFCHFGKSSLLYSIGMYFCMQMNSYIATHIANGA